MKNQKSKTKLNAILKGGLAVCLMSPSLLAIGQTLPSDFITKLSYNEHKSVVYEFPDTSTLNCLNFQETAEYHNYQQEFNKTEIIDLNGKICSEHHLTYEQNVRDEWMVKFDRILTLPQNTFFYKNNDSLVYHSYVLEDSNTVVLSTADALEFGYFNYSSTFYTELKDTLTAYGIAFQESNNVLTYQSGIYNLSWDNNTKIEMITEKNENGDKVKETTIENEYFEHINTFQPINKSVVEWILTANGCCVRKTTIIIYARYQREVNAAIISASPLKSTKQELLPKNKNNTSISTIAETNSFLIQSSSDELFMVKIYSADGKLVEQLKAKANEAIALPKQFRSGLYLIHVYQANNTRPVVGKIILSKN